MLYRLKTLVKKNRVAVRASRAVGSRLQPVRDFTSCHLGPRHGRRFRKVTEYLRPTRSAGYIGWVGNGNVGDEALFAVFQKLFPDFAALLYDRHPFELRLHRRLVASKPFFDFVALGGGTLFSYRPYYYQVDHALNHGRPLMTFGTGVEDPAFYTDAAKRTAYESLLRDWAQRLHGQPRIFVRGPHTAEVLARFGLTETRVIGDPALTLCDPSTRRPGGRRVGINLGCDGQLWGRQDTVEDAVTAAIGYLLDNGWQVEFIAMEPIDHDICRRLARRIGSRLQVAPLTDSPHTVMDRLAGCDFVIGQRLHAIILAAGLGVPVIAMEYRPKVADFMASVNLLPLSIRADRITKDRLISAIEDVTSRLDPLSQHLVTTGDQFRRLQQAAAAETLAAIPVCRTK
jgi:hypothetical protein